MKILALPRYSRRAASSRYRMFQFEGYFRGLGWEIDYHPLLDDSYIGYLYSGSRFPFASVIRGYADRVLRFLGNGQYDLIWLQQEAFPWMPYPAERLLASARAPIVVDMDDAFFHRYDKHGSSVVRTIMGRKIDSVLRRSALVVAGNEYLANRAVDSGARRVEVVPTVINLEDYQIVKTPGNDQYTLGWIGSPGTSAYLDMLGDAVRQLREEAPLKFVAVGASAKANEIGAEVRQWSVATEVQDLQQIDVGVMPLPDSYWERGKCGFKIIQYMACGKPAVASPVGANRVIISHGIDGFHARTKEEWVGALRTLRDDGTLRETMGRNARKKVEESYNSGIVAPRLARLFSEIGGS